MPSYQIGNAETTRPHKNWKTGQKTSFLIGQGTPIAAAEKFKEFPKELRK